MTKSLHAPALARSVLRIVAARNTPVAELPQLVATLYQALKRVVEKPETNEPISSSLPSPPPVSPAWAVPRKPRRRIPPGERMPAEQDTARRASADHAPAASLPAADGKEPGTRKPAQGQPAKKNMPRKRAEFGREAALSAPPVQESRPPVVSAAPGLMRRADIVGGEAGFGSRIVQPPRSTVRGIVKWFDTKSRRGALRLPGFGDEVMVDDALLARAGIARLFKGQEIEAAIVMEGGRINLLSLSLPGRAAGPPANTLFGAGAVATKSAARRQARPVVIELKRDALRRVAARVEAEQLLGSDPGSRPAAKSSAQSSAGASLSIGPGRAGSTRRRP